MDLGETTPRVLRFGVFELDRRSGELRKDGLRVRLQEQPLRVLETLLDAQGEAVTREALRQRLWPDDTFVDFDGGLNRAMNRLRAALGDEADHPHFIETLGRRGYRFIAPVTAPEAVALAGPAPPAEESLAPGAPRSRRGAWLGTALAAAAVVALAIALVPALRRGAASRDRVSIRSLAVLPLANLTGDPTQDYFSDGMTDALITNLASWPGLRVISRQSVMRYKGSARPLPEIARELGVDGVVEGSVVRSGGRVRITAQLVHAPTDRHLWAHSYERRLEDVLALQGEVSRAIAEEVRITVGANEARRAPREHAVNPEAYDAYLLGLHHWNLRTASGLDRATGYFRAAIAKDPDFAEAHAGLAMAYPPRFVFGYIPPGHGLTELKAAARRALELDPGLGEAHAALGSALAYDWDWDGAEREYLNAVETDPNSSVAHLWYGWYLHALGRFGESLAERRRALELDPLNVAVNRGVARDLDATGPDEAAQAQWNRVLEIEPDQAISHLQVALAHFERGRAALGWRHLQRARSLAPDDPSVLAALSIASAVGGKPEQARVLLGRLQAISAQGYVSPVVQAFIHAALGELDRAFALLEEGYVLKDPAIIPIQNLETQMGLRLPPDRAAALRSDPRYADLVRRMGFPRRTAVSTASTPSSVAIR